MNSTVSSLVTQKIKQMLRENVPVSEIAKVLKVDPIIVRHIDHEWICEELLRDDSDGIETIDELVTSTDKDEVEHGKAVENDRKQLAILLTNFGVPTNQIHLATKLSIYSVRSIIDQQKKSGQIIEESCTLPQTIVSRIIVSIFINHYNSIDNEIDDLMTSPESESNEYNELNKIVVAWLRTKEEIKSSGLIRCLKLIRDRTQHFKELDLNERFLSLGTLFPIAHYLRLNGYRQKAGIITRRKKKASYICEADCKVATCRCHYAYFMPGKDTCPYCDLERLFNVSLIKNGATATRDEATKTQKDTGAESSGSSEFVLRPKSKSANKINEKDPVCLESRYFRSGSEGSEVATFKTKDTQPVENKSKSRETPKNKLSEGCKTDDVSSSEVATFVANGLKSVEPQGTTEQGA